MKLRHSKSFQSELRAEQSEDNLVIEGYFAVFNSRTELWRGVFEEIAPGAFDESLSNDVRALVNHDTTLVLGRNKAGTLELKTDSKGLWGKVVINPDDSDAMNLYNRTKRGDVDQCSFGFEILDEEPPVNNPDGSVVFRLNKVSLHEVSVCTFPAYPDTSVQARNNDLEQHRNRQWEVRKSELKRRLKDA